MDLHHAQEKSKLDAENSASRDENDKDKQQARSSNSSETKRPDLTVFLVGLMAYHSQEALSGKRARQDEPRHDEEEEERAELDLGMDDDHQRQEDRAMPPKGIDSVLDGDQQGQKKKKQFECKQCATYFVDYRALGGHVASHDNNKSAKQKKIDDSPSGVDLCLVGNQQFRRRRCSFSKKKTEVFECKQCGIWFATYMSLGGHMASHTKKKKEVHDGKFKCDECIKCFNSKRGLNVHVTSKHCPVDRTAIASTSGSCRPPTKKDE